MNGKNMKLACIFWNFVVCSGLMMSLTMCRHAPGYEVTGESGGTVPMTARWDSSATDPVIDSVLSYYKSKVDQVMDKKIGVSDVNMDIDRPQSVLSNFTADVLYEMTEDYLDRDVDFAVINIGGIRTSLNKGDVTMGDIFSIFPFENALTLVSLKGDAVQELFGNIAAAKGEGISSQVRLRFTLDYELESASVSGEPVDPERVYRIATIDYVADGNDGLTAFKKAVERIDTGKRLRDMMLEYVSGQTAEGEALHAETDDRIVIE